MTLYKMFKSGNYMHMKLEAGKPDVSVTSDGVWVIEDEAERSDGVFIVDSGVPNECAAAAA